MSNVVPIKEFSSKMFESYKNETIMCVHCNHAFHGTDVVLKLDNERITPETYDSEKHKVVSLDGVNAYWLSCPSCENINENGYRPVLGGISENGAYMF